MASRPEWDSRWWVRHFSGDSGAREVVQAPTKVGARRRGRQYRRWSEEHQECRDIATLGDYELVFARMHKIVLGPYPTKEAAQLAAMIRMAGGNDRA